MRRLTRLLRRAAHRLLPLLLPFRCAACGRLEAVVTAPPAALAQAPLMGLLCGACRETIVPVSAPLCSACGIPFGPSGAGEHRCGRCLSQPAPLARMRAAAVYQGAMVLLMRQFKYHQRVHLAAAMRPWLSATYHRHWHPGKVDLVVPVPLHRRRLRQRGYNQAWLLARQLFDEKTAPRAPALRRDLLVRHRDTPSQTGLASDRRRQNVHGAFSVCDRRAVTEKYVLLIDDVVTTGATIRACADVLLAAGARRVDALSMARTLPRPR